jgi:hypothetical protein
MGTQAVEQQSQAGMELVHGGVTSASRGKGRWVEMGAGGKERPAAAPRSSGEGYTLSLAAIVSGRVETCLIPF